MGQVYFLLFILCLLGMAWIYVQQKMKGATTIGSGGSALVSGVEGQMRMVGWALDPVKTAAMFQKVARGATQVIAKGWRLLVNFCFSYAKNSKVISYFAKAYKYKRTQYANEGTIIEYRINGPSLQPKSDDPNWQPDLSMMPSFTICTVNGFVFTRDRVAVMVERKVAWALGCMFQLRPNIDDTGGDQDWDWGKAHYVPFPAMRILHAMKALCAGCPNALQCCGLLVSRVLGDSADKICDAFGVERGAHVYVNLAPGMEGNEDAMHAAYDWINYAINDRHPTNFTPSEFVIPGCYRLNGQFTVTASPALIDPAAFDAEVASLEAMLN